MIPLMIQQDHIGYLPKKYQWNTKEQMLRNYVHWRANFIAQLGDDGFTKDIYDMNGTYVGSVNFEKGFFQKEDPPKRKFQHEGWAIFEDGDYVKVFAERRNTYSDEASYLITRGPWKNKTFWASPECKEKNGYILVPIEDFAKIKF